MKFSMKSMILFVTGLSIYLAIIFALPSWLSLISLMLITLVMPAIYVSGILYARGAWRVFWIGSAATAIVPQISAVYYAIILGFGLLAWQDVSNSGDATAITALAASQILPQLGGLVALFVRGIYR